MRILALDFDGVISDSAAEAFLVALRAYVSQRASSALAAPLAELDGPRGPRREAIADHDLYRRFLEIMPLGNRAEDFAVGLAALESGESIREQADYDRFKASQRADFLASFHARFYEVRHAFADREPEAWLQLLAPYPEFVALLHRRAADVRLAIATAKDRPSVVRLLGAYGIDDLFPAAYVLDKEAGVSKRAHLTALQARLGSDFESITFVDDKVNHLEDVAPLGVRCALAGWGYNAEREHARARACGFAVCSIESAEADLFD